MIKLLQKTVWQFLIKLNIHIFVTGISLPGIQQGEMNTYLDEKAYKTMFIEV